MPTQEQVDQLRSLLKAAYTFGERYRGEHDNQPQPDSLLDRQIQEQERLRDCFGASLLAVVASTNQLLALSRVLAPPVMLFAPAVLTRAAIEAAAKASWLLDLGIDARERYSRWANVRVEELRRGIQDAEDDPDQRKRLETRREQLWVEAGEQGYEIKLDRNDKRIGVVRDAPKITELVDLVLAPFADSLGPLADRLGVVYYRRLSAVAHATFSGQIRSYEARRDPRLPGFQILFPDPLANVDLWAIAALESWLVAYDRLVQAAGWDFPEWQLWRDRFI